MALFFDTVQKQKNGSCEAKVGCHYGTINDISGEIIVEKPVINGLNLHLKFSNIDETYYSRMIASLSRGDDERILYELDLDLSECTE